MAEMRQEWVSLDGTTVMVLEAREADGNVVRNSGVYLDFVTSDDSRPWYSHTDTVWLTLWERRSWQRFGRIRDLLSKVTPLMFEAYASGNIESIRRLIGNNIKPFVEKD